jgi:hypothetical protein
MDRPMDSERAADLLANDLSREAEGLRGSSIRTPSGPTWPVGQFGRQSKTPVRIASLHLELCTFTAAASEQFEPPSGAADTRLLVVSVSPAGQT